MAEEVGLDTKMEEARVREMTWCRLCVGCGEMLRDNGRLGEAGCHLSSPPISSSTMIDASVAFDSAGRRDAAAFQVIRACMWNASNLVATARAEHRREKRKNADADRY